MKILLDENLPHAILFFLRKEGHQVESVNTLRLKGIENGKLYKEVAQNYDLFLTRDVGFIEAIRNIKLKSQCLSLRVIIPQQPKEKFLPLFIKSFKDTNWKQYKNGEDWPL